MSWQLMRITNLDQFFSPTELHADQILIHSTSRINLNFNIVLYSNLNC